MVSGCRNPRLRLGAFTFQVRQRSTSNYHPSELSYISRFSFPPLLLSFPSHCATAHHSPLLLPSKTLSKLSPSVSSISTPITIHLPFPYLSPLTSLQNPSQPFTVLPIITFTPAVADFPHYHQKLNRQIHTPKFIRPSRCLQKPSTRSNRSLLAPKVRQQIPKR